jgi:glutamyl-tRNA synthetase/glutamyl-Q tRNA(Asp) synthetase
MVQIHDSRLMLSRFAPSPTGYLHLGHVVNAIYVWGAARAAAGQVLLRIEDHDRVRCRPEYEQALLEDLDWLGFRADDGRDPLLRQSDEPAAYERALEHLRRTAAVYVCDCSRKDIGGKRYQGRCRTRGLQDGPGRGLRVAIAPGVERFDDLLLGRQEQVPADQCGDLLLRDRDGHWTYQFAVTVDDYRQHITHVIRGADLLSSTGRQIRLGRMLGRAEPPRFLHHPLILKEKGEKLSKSDRDTGVRDLRRSGLTPAEVIGRAAAAVGLIKTLRPVEAKGIEELFRSI